MLGLADLSVERFHGVDGVLSLSEMDEGVVSDLLHSLHCACSTNRKSTFLKPNFFLQTLVLKYKILQILLLNVCLSKSAVQLQNEQQQDAFRDNQSFDRTWLQAVELLLDGLLCRLQHQVPHIQNLHCCHGILVNLHLRLRPVHSDGVTPQLDTT